MIPKDVYELGDHYRYRYYIINYLNVYVINFLVNSNWFFSIKVKTIILLNK